MSAISASWGLRLDLGYEIADESLKQLFDHLWEDAFFEGPNFKMGTCQGVPAMAEGKLNLPTSSGGAGKAYTKIEKDTLGFPAGWDAPLSLSLSLFGFADNLPEHEGLYAYALEQIKALYALHPFRMAMVGDLACYYVDADMISVDWVDMHQESVKALVLAADHALVKVLESQVFAEGLRLFEQEQLKALWTEDDLNTRHARYKQGAAEAMHSDKLQLEWETPEEN